VAPSKCRRLEYTFHIFIWKYGDTKARWCRFWKSLRLRTKEGDSGFGWTTRLVATVLNDSIVCNLTRPLLSILFTEI
jgi:hypothetical protein